MTIREIIFCDICNPRGLKPVEFRREPRSDGSKGRRICDGRSWSEEPASNAMLNGWLFMPDGRHVCPVCRAAGHVISDIVADPAD